MTLEVSTRCFVAGWAQLPRAPHRHTALTRLLAVQTDVKDPTAESSADDFLAREKALLGDDADQFKTTEDATAPVGETNDDLLGGAPDANAQSTFESQFPDITAEQPVGRAHSL